MTELCFEIELKLLCAPDDLPLVLAAAPAGEEESRELISVYFDTEDQDLRRAGVSLRVRESGGRQVQTLKREADGVAREEHEVPISGRTPDPRLGPLKALLPQARALRPAFNVNVSRLQRTLSYRGALIELAADQGEVRSGRRRRSISEVELELKDGSARALFELARELGKAAPLYLSFTSKSERGQALVGGAGPVESTRPRLGRVADTAAAFQAIARRAFKDAVCAAEALSAAPLPESVHRLRVSVRRLRSAISVFKPVVADAAMAHVTAELKWLGAACDDLRNLDVFAAETVGPAGARHPDNAELRALARSVASARGASAAQLIATLRTQRFRDLLMDACAWIETGAWLEAKATTKRREVAARTFAAKALKRRRNRLIKAAADLATLSPDDRHRARIEAKKLRYAAEAFAPLFAGKATAAFIRPLKVLQTELGALNDVATSEALVRKLSLDAPTAFAAGELVGARRAKGPSHVRAACKALRKVDRAKAFW